MTPIIRPSELEYTVSFQPRVRAHAGESSSAYPPTFCLRSDSRPASSSGLDSGDPCWTSPTVRKMYRKNCRYSDCQFSATSTPKLAEVTYRPQETRGRPSAICCWLK